MECEGPATSREKSCFKLHSVSQFCPHAETQFDSFSVHHSQLVYIMEFIHWNTAHLQINHPPSPSSEDGEFLVHGTSSYSLFVKVSFFFFFINLDFIFIYCWVCSKCLSIVLTRLWILPQQVLIEGICCSQCRENSLLMFPYWPWATPLLGWGLLDLSAGIQYMWVIWVGERRQKQLKLKSTALKSLSQSHQSQCFFYIHLGMAGHFLTVTNTSPPHVSTFTWESCTGLGTRKY